MHSAQDFQQTSRVAADRVYPELCSVAHGVQISLWRLSISLHVSLLAFEHLLVFVRVSTCVWNCCLYSQIQASILVCNLITDEALHWQRMQLSLKCSYFNSDGSFYFVETVWHHAQLSCCSAQGKLAKRPRVDLCLQSLPFTLIVLPYAQGGVAFTMGLCPH